MRHLQTRNGTSNNLWNSVWGLLDDFDTDFPAFRLSQSSHLPNCDIVETKDAYILNLDAPGMKKEDFDIEINGHQLLISGERKRDEEFSEGNLHRTERSYGKFQRVFTVPENTDPNVIEAQYEQGVLKVAIPKGEGTRARKVTIGAENSKGLLGRKKETMEVHKVEAKNASN